MPLQKKRVGRPRQPTDLDPDVLKTAVQLYSLESGKTILAALQETGIKVTRNEMYRAMQRAGIRRVRTVRSDLPFDRKRKLFQWCSDVGKIKNRSTLSRGLFLRWLNQKMIKHLPFADEREPPKEDSVSF